MTRFTSILAGVLLIGCIAAERGFADARYQASRVVAFGDVHGAYQALTELLIQVGVVDEQLTWQAGATHLVSLGDLLDRGPDSRAVLDLLRRLQSEADAAGGRVHVLLGNHELMNLTGDLRYVSAGERRAFAEPGAAAADPGLAGLRAAYAPDGPYGSWLLEQPVTVVINDAAFVHGGLSPLLVGLEPERLNVDVRTRLDELLRIRSRLVAGGLVPVDLAVHDAAAQLNAPELALGDEQKALAQRFIELVDDPLFGDEGPFWYRGNAWCHPLIEAHSLARVFQAWKVNRVVVGHTPTVDHRVHVRMGGSVVLADTGMLASHYGGRASAVILEAGRVSVRYANESGSVAALADSGTPLDPLDEAAVLAALRDFQPAAPGTDAWEVLPLGTGDQVAARFTETSGRARNAELAALRLDRLLDLNLVAPVVPREIERRDGVAVASWPGVVTEEQRAAVDGAGPPRCAGGSVFDLLYAFDALIGNQGRSARTIIYEPRTRRLGSLGHGASFARGTRFPAYLQQTRHSVPAALATRLAALDEAELQAQLGDLLSVRQIRALLKRRDRLLAEWTVEG